MNPSQPPDHLQRAESWLAFLMRGMAFVVGITVFLYEVFIGHDRVLALGAAGFCGPVVAQGVATVVAAMRGGRSDA